MVNYGFVIDDRKCIGCHACTVACKSEHDVPVGVDRTHVKYTEKGIFPDSTREFSVHRCNHCEDAPCTTICPTTALFTRADGIVDFDSKRCIACKSCMQACPYDALYIDPRTQTAAKCNYCAHRTDRGYEPACVVVCPVEAIISGDLNDPGSRIARFVDIHDVSVRKPDKGTVPNLYTYSEETAPAEVPQQQDYLWSEQSTGVGHYAKFAEERLCGSNNDNLLLQLALEGKRGQSADDDRIIANVMKQLEEDAGSERRVYDSPSKGVLWGWEIPAYIWTKAVSAGLFMVTYILLWLGQTISPGVELVSLSLSMLFLMLSMVMLVLDLDRPERFHYVMLRPNWSSWLVRGAYILAAFGAILGLMILANLLGWSHNRWLA
ncbi:MAG: 4Fe-4S dicluster domain-containing protein, partial [Verrucomicrobiales bacterium]